MSHIEYLFDVLAHCQAFKTIMLVEPRMTFFLMEGLHYEDWDYLSEILSLSNQSWQLYRSRHEHLVSWHEWQTSSYLHPWNTYQAYRAHMMNPDSGIMAKPGQGQREGAGAGPGVSAAAAAVG